MRTLPLYMGPLGLTRISLSSMRLSDVKDLGRKKKHYLKKICSSVTNLPSTNATQEGNDGGICCICDIIALSFVPLTMSTQNAAMGTCRVAVTNMTWLFNVFNCCIKIKSLASKAPLPACPRISSFLCSIFLEI